MVEIEIPIEVEECQCIIEEISNYLIGIRGSYPNRVKNNLKFLKVLQYEVVENRDFVSIVKKSLEPIIIKINSFENEDPDEEKIKDFQLSIFQSLKIARNRCNHITSSHNIHNSENYYVEKIEELNKQQKYLVEKLNDTKVNLENKSEKTIELEKQADKIKKDLENYKSQLELKKKEEDAKNAWVDKIDSTFKSLKSYLNPISYEQRRLKLLWGIYSVLSVLLVVFIIVIEYNAFLKIIAQEGFPKFKEYITVFLPLPVAGGLLWGFIFQMNRAQRQLVVLAKSIHSVEYVQGLLLAINNLSPSIEDAIIRINSALDKLIDNHLSQEDVSTESGLIKEENKDSLPIDSVLKILKEAKGFVKN